ncbi:MAG: single-stranded DNA-binding protein [bacterium]
MMASVNKAIIVGNLGQDPDIRYTPGGQAVANFSVATTEKWTNKQTGNLDEKTEWHRVVVWGKLAELCREYLHKGRSIYVEGRIQTRTWDDKDGNKRYTTEIVAQQVQFLGRRDETHTPAPQGQTTQTTQSTSQESGPPPFDSEDDIPF